MNLVCFRWQKGRIQSDKRWGEGVELCVTSVAKISAAYKPYSTLSQYMHRFDSKFSAGQVQWTPTV